MPARIVSFPVNLPSLAQKHTPVGDDPYDTHKLRRDREIQSLLTVAVVVETGVPVFGGYLIPDEGQVLDTGVSTENQIAARLAKTITH